MYDRAIVLKGPFEIEFVSRWQRTAIAVRDIYAVWANPLWPGHFTIACRSRKSFEIYGLFDGFHEFIAALRVANPNIEVRGA